MSASATQRIGTQTCLNRLGFGHRVGKSKAYTPMEAGV